MEIKRGELFTFLTPKSSAGPYKLTVDDVYICDVFIAGGRGDEEI
ncbi:MAG: hypothetical protein K0Q49_135 [Haloplasmataceae bacterium]|nr:hypothetical protein [Haloplasmataceae bacterium]